MKPEQQSLFDPPPEAHATVALRGAEKAAAESKAATPPVPVVESGSFAASLAYLFSLGHSE